MPGDLPHNHPCTCFALCTVHVPQPFLITHAPALYVVLACACHAPTCAPFGIAHAPALYVMPAVFRWWLSLTEILSLHPTPPLLSLSCAQTSLSPFLPGSRTRGGVPPSARVFCVSACGCAVFLNLWFTEFLVWFFFSIKKVFPSLLADLAEIGPPPPLGWLSASSCYT